MRILDLVIGRFKGYISSRISCIAIYNISRGVYMQSLVVTHLLTKWSGPSTFFPGFTVD